MFLLVMLVRLSYYCYFLHFDRSEERRDRAKITFKQSQALLKDLAN